MCQEHYNTYHKIVSYFDFIHNFEHLKGNSSVWQFGKREKQVKLEQDDIWDAWTWEHENITYFWKLNVRCVSMSMYEHMILSYEMTCEMHKMWANRSILDDIEKAWAGELWAHKIY